MPRFSQLMKDFRRIAIFCAILPAMALEAGSDWPQWRGPARDGKSAETGLLRAWPESGPEVIWKAPSGDGYASVIAVQGRLYSLWSEQDGQKAICLDAATGKQIWNTRIGRDYRDGMGNGPRATPAFTDGIVVFAGANGELAAVEASSGKIRWQHDLKAKFGLRTPTWGYSCSPLILGDRVIMETAGKSGKAYTAFALQTGKVLWQAGSARTGYSSPVTANIGGREQLLFFSADGIHGVRQNNGKSLWLYPWSTLYDVNAIDPVVVDSQFVYISSGYNTGAALLKFTAFGKPKEVWRSRGMSNHYSTPILLGDALYGFDERLLKCIDVKTGKERWKQRGFQKGSLMYADGMLIVLGERGRLALVAANPNQYEELASAKVLSGKCWTVPTLSDGQLYVRNERELLALKMVGSQAGL